jgi:signal transduction histidine kinase
LRRILQERSVLGAFGATVLSLYLLVAWTRELQPGWLLAATAALAMAVVVSVRLRRSGRSTPGGLPISMALLLLGMAMAAFFSWQFQRIERDWSGVVDRRQAGLGASLERQMLDVVDRGGQASRAAATIAASVRSDLFRQLALLQEHLRVDAVAVYTDAGDLVAWAGEHRGPLPDSIWISGASAFFQERPLFSYLYFPTRVAGREEYAVAAVLVETGIIGEGREGAFADIVAARTRTRASFRRGGHPSAAWSLVEGSDTIAHARVDPLTQAEWRGALNRTARRAGLIAVAGALLAWAVAWLRWTRPLHIRLAPVVPLLVLIPVMAFAPLRDATGATRFFSPLLFTLPLPGDISLGRLLAVVLAVAAMAAGTRRGARPVRQVLVLTVAGGAAIAALYPFVLQLLLDGATPALLQSDVPLWIGLQMAVVLTLATLTLLLMHRTAGAGQPPGWLSRPTRRLLLLAAASSSALLGAGVTAAASPVAPVSLAFAALWAVPFVLAGLALSPLGGRGGALMRWLMAGWLATTASLPYVWAAHLDARIAAAESEIGTLGTRADPYLDYLLVSFGREAAARFAAGEEGVQLLYRTWVASGLAQESYAARIVLWSPLGTPDVQLGTAPVLSEHEANLLTAVVQDARTHAAPLITPFTDLPNLSKLLTVPVPDGSLITVVVPPRRTLDRTSAVAPFLGIVAQSPTRLNLIEATGAEQTIKPIHWVESPQGWRSEAMVKYPDGWYHAHLLVPTPGTGVRLVRATLLLTLNLSLLAALWVLGVLGRGHAAVPRGEWTGWLGSFRARVTVALFAFFIVPTAVFGWAAYSALAGEVARAAQRLAQHAVTQAVLEFDDAAGDLRRLAAHANTDVLRYHGGELIDVSSREAFDLGVYSAWMPPQIFQRLQSGEEREALATETLGQHAFVTAYRAMLPSGTLGVPMSLSAGEAAVRLRELAHLVLFAAVLGAVLSLALSLAVGRALAGPIAQLRRASAAVGAGSLRARLPERAGDEFGQLFASFNRMTRRLRRARARELRTARVLAWGEMARQVAHEIKNPLTPIKLSVQHLRRAHRDQHPQFEEILDSNVSQILVEIDRLSEIARAFSRYGAPADAAGPLTTVDVPTVIREALTLYRSGDAQVQYRDVVEPGLPRVLARPDELKEVLLNVVENARAALNGKGSITISAAVQGDRVEMRIADTGPGIAQDLLGRIFEPHFSTRSTGTGLGLAIVRRLVESWGGTVHAESEPGNGTVITVRLLAASSTTLEQGATEPGNS